MQLDDLEIDLAKIRADMHLKGWQPVDLARGAGVHKSTITRFLDEESQTAPVMKKIADALGYSVRRYAKRAPVPA